MNFALKTALLLGKVSVTFTKVSDGSDRTMICTMKTALIPLVTTHESEVEHDNDLAIVYDFEVSDWRSFRYDTVKDWHPV